MGLRKRVKALFDGRTTDKRRAKLFNFSSTGSLKPHQKGDIGSDIAFISTYWSGGHAIITPFLLGKELMDAGFSVVIVVTSDRAPNFDVIVKRLEDRGISTSSFTIVMRENIGKDFGSFKDAFHYFQSEIAGAERVFIGNDSLIGPLFPSDYFQRLRNASPGFWGVTESFDRSYHLQSSHLLFVGRETVARAQEFFRGYRFYRNRDNIVRYGEIGISKWSLRQKISIKAFYTMGTLAQRKKHDLVQGKQKEFWLDTNPQHFYFDALLDEGFPFVKRELLTANPMQLREVYGRVFFRMEELDQPLDTLFQHFRPI